MADDLQLKTTLTADAGPLNSTLRASGQAVLTYATEVEAANKRQAAAEQGATTAAAAHAAAMRQAVADSAPVIKMSDGMAAAALEEAKAVRVASSEMAAAEALRKAKASAEQEAMRGSTISAGQLSMAYRQLPAQITDITTSLVSGMPIWTVAIQQGGQIKDSFGGIRPAMSALLALVSPTAVALGSLAVAGGGLAYAMYSGRAESDALEKSLRLTGNAAGLSHGQIDSLSQSIAVQRDITIASAREITAALVDQGNFGGAALMSVSQAAAAMSKATGKSAADLAAQFAGMADSPTQWAAKANAAYHFLSIAQYEQIQLLEAQGLKQEAVRIAAEAFAGTLTQRTGPALGFIDRQMQEHNRLWSEFWDTLKGIGRETTAEDRIRSLTERAADLKANPGIYGPRRAELPKVQAQLDSENNTNNHDLLRRSEALIAQQEVQRQIEDDSAAHQAVLVNTARSGSALLQATIEAGLVARRSAEDLAWQRGEETAKRYQQHLLEIDTAAIEAKIQNTDRLIAAEALRKVTTEDEAAGRASAIQQLDAQRVALRADLAKLKADERAGIRDITPKLGAILPSDGLRAMRSADEAASDAAVNARKEASAAAEAELLASAKASSQALIQDAQARALALIATDEARLRKQLDFEGLSAAERRQMEIDVTTASAQELARREELEAKSATNRKRIEDELSAWRTGREKEVTQQFAPEWKKMVDGWKDVNQLMKTSFDTTMLATLNAGENAWVQFAQTGKLSVKSLVDTIAAESARAAYRSFMGQVAPFVGNAIGSFFGTGTGEGLTTGGPSLADLGLGGGRANGGPVAPNSLQPVNERGPEVLTIAGQDYLMMGSAAGQVTRNEDALKPLAMPRGGGGATSAAAGGSAPTAVLNLTVVNQTATPVKASATQRPDGGVELLLQAAEESMAGNVMQGAGPMSRALEQRYGLRST